MKINVRLGWLIAGFVGGILATIWNTIVFLGGLIIGADTRTNANKNTVENRVAPWSPATTSFSASVSREISKLTERIDNLEDAIAEKSDGDSE